MITCEMSGCHDMAEYSAEFDADEETNEDQIFSICESCADYWRNHKEESPTITAWKVAQK
jgi:predicted metal-binding protein